MNPWLIIAAGVIGLASYFAGFQNGHSNAEADCNTERLEEIKAGQKLEEERVELVKERDALQQQLEEQANATPVLHTQCLGADRVLRLNRYR